MRDVWDLSKRRTNPGFLSDDEVARDRRRTEEFVHSLVNGGQVKRDRYVNRECDSCGVLIQSPSYHCQKCDICFCPACGKEFALMQKKVCPECPQCDTRLE